ncbi:MAG: hypothetical protein H6767_10055 [Candidatus Peribacteria bacterium]|nr:MAG: hypothetical protein H6767_10055 [Candidatus Peribacteria bacterium]
MIVHYKLYSDTEKTIARPTAVVIDSGKTTAEILKTETIIYEASTQMRETSSEITK